jgi:hypothetical protein
MSDAVRANYPMWIRDISISTASIKFTPSPPACTTSCTYTAQAIWAAGDAPRQCNTKFVKADDVAVPSPSNLPTDVFPTGPAPDATQPYTIVAVDVVFTYHPIFASYFGVSLPISRSVFIAPRYVSTISFQLSSTNPFAGMFPRFCAGQGS